MRLVALFFPGGGAGAGLLLIRISVAVSLLITASAANPSSFRLPVALLLSVPIAIGYRTRIATALGISMTFYLCVLSHGPLLSSLPQIVTALGLLCTGPGAFSVDAYAFGRSTMVVAGRTDLSSLRNEITAGEDPPN
jgi:hypothetical protein